MEHLARRRFAAGKVDLIQLSQDARNRSEFLVQLGQVCHRVCRAIVRQHHTHDFAACGHASHDRQSIFGCLLQKAACESCEFRTGHLRCKRKGIMTREDISEKIRDLLTIGVSIDPVLQHNICHRRSPYPTVESQNRRVDLDKSSAAWALSLGTTLLVISSTHDCPLAIAEVKSNAAKRVVSIVFIRKVSGPRWSFPVRIAADQTTIPSEVGLGKRHWRQ